MAPAVVVEGDCLKRSSEALYPSRFLHHTAMAASVMGDD